MSWEPIGRQSSGNLCKGPLVALHLSSQVTEFTSLIIGSNRKVIGIECCHRINVSQLHINVSALLYCLCLRNTVASKYCLSTTIGKTSALSEPAHSLAGGSQNCLLQFRPVGSANTSSLPPPRDEAPPWEAEGIQASHCAVLGAVPVDTGTSPSPGFQLGR